MGKKFTIELIDGSKVHASSWKTKVGGIWPAMTPSGWIEAKDAIFERKNGETTEHPSLSIPVTSIIAVYEKPIEAKRSPQDPREKA